MSDYGRNDMNQAETLAEIRKTARDNGLTFKAQNARINGKQGYKFVNRISGLVVGENFTINSAYEDVCSGYVGNLGK